MANSGDGKLRNGVIEFAGANTPGWISNLGCTYAAGTFTITDAQGDALTANNPGFITVPSTTAGQMVTLKVTAGGTFNDDAHASSSLTNLGFGITESADWAQDMPFFIHVINRANADIDGADGSSVFCFSRNPSMHTSPSSANDIGDTGAIPSNDSQNVVFIMDDVTVANYTSLPTQLCGSFRMQWVTSSDDWTVQTLGNTDGIGQTQLRKQFARTWTFPVAQNGATSTHFISNAGTVPAFTTSTFTYEITQEGHIVFDAIFTGDGGTDGSGAQTLEISMPYVLNVASDRPIGTGRVECSAFDLLSIVNGKASASRFEMTVQTLSGAAVQNDVKAIINSDFGNGARTISAHADYRAF